MSALRFPALLSAAALFIFSAIPGFAAPSLNQQIDPPEASVGDDVVISYTVQNGSGANIHLPPVDGLQSGGVSSATNISFNNGAFSSSFTEAFHVSPTHAGDFTIPAFDIHLQDGSVLRTQPMKLHVLSSASSSSSPSGTAANPTPPANVLPIPFNPNGPVVMPPNNGQPAPNAPANPANPNDTSGSNPNVPMETDGRPARVFMTITPQTTDAYVGQSIPMRIEWFIRADVDAQQDSLPTIKGSDFLMNNLSVRLREDEVAIMNEGYRRESWNTAISAPKSGDFPLQMERDSYWAKGPAQTTIDPFTNFFPGRPKLAHESIPSNQFTVHVHLLPTDGRPASFTGAIGQFIVTGTAQPESVAVGEPVTLHFSVSGQGNFDYVRCPALAADPAWKTYVPSAKVEYQEESHTQGVKNFEMAVIPQKGGTLPLPQATFSYFDPTSKQYVSIPVNLPAITVTGSPSTASNPAAANADSTSATAATATTGFLPNRADSGSTQTNLIPIYRQSWFWIVQGGLLALLIIGAVVLILRSCSKPDNDLAERQQRQQTLTREEDAMSEAVRNGDAMAFFVAARHAIQLQLGTQWRVKPESLTLAEIRQRDPQLAQTLEPLFAQADEIIYSGGTGLNLDLAHWERHVRELLQTSKHPA
jgi:hypothetical protein